MIAPTLWDLPSAGHCQTWIKNNVKPLGFPFNQYFPFYILSLIAIINLLLCSRIPSYMDKSQCLNEENLNEDTANGIENKPGKITKITVGHFKQSDWLV